MKNILKRLVTFFLLINIACALANPALNTNIISFHKTLTLAPDQSPACQVAFHDIKLNGTFLYYYNPKTLIGLGYALITNPANGMMINSTLYQLGESDRLAFSHYYNPLLPFQLDDQTVFIYSIMMDICPDSRQVAMQINLNDQVPGETCLFTAGPWNYCR